MTADVASSAEPPPLVVTSATVSVSGAAALIRAAVDTAIERELALAMAVVDRAGDLVVSWRMDGATPAAATLAADKAFTAAMFGYPTDAWLEITQPGGADWGLTSALGGRMIVIGGGLPLRWQGQLVGGFGVSGAAPAVDAECAAAAVAAAWSEPPHT